MEKKEKVFHPSDHPNFEEGLKAFKEFIKRHEQMKKDMKEKGKGKKKPQPAIPYKRGSWRHNQESEMQEAIERMEEEHYEDNY